MRVFYLAALLRGSSFCSITKLHILEYMQVRIKKDGVKAATVNREAVFVKGMLSCAFATWLQMAGVSLDSLRPLLRHRNRSSTDRYASIDRLALGKVLSVMPSVREENEHKKMALSI